MINTSKKYKNIFFLTMFILGASSFNYAQAETILEINNTGQATTSSSFMSSGKASWYAYKGGMFAASPDFTAGTKLKVTSVSNPEKKIVVIVNDYGPNRAIHPDRVIDLDKVAFAKLAPLGAGVINVTVEPFDVKISTKEAVKLEPAAAVATTSEELSANDEDLSKAFVLNNRASVNYNTGELLQDTKTGGVYWVTSSGKQPLTDRVFLKSIFKDKKINQKTTSFLATLKTLSPVVFLDGYLIKSPNNSVVYLIYKNERRAFLSGDVFEGLGYAWNDIVIAPDKLINQYKQGLPLNSSNIKNLEVSAVNKEATVIKKEVAEEISLTSKSAVVISATDGKIIYSKNASEQLPLASLSKLVAMKVFLDTKPNLNKVVTYKVQDENYNYKYADKSVLARLTVSDGETMTIRDLLYSSVLGSANNAVESLVRVSSLSRQAFIIRMNQYVKSIGATQTNFVEPTGLSPENVSSALDYALIARSVLKDGNLEKVSMTKNYSFSTVNTKKAHYIKNSNNLFFTSNLKITGSKTGYLDEALYCLMTRAKDNAGHEVIAITFGTPDRTSSFKETENLLNYGLKYGI